MNESELIESLEKTAYTTGAGANCFFQAFIHTLCAQVPEVIDSISKFPGSQKLIEIFNRKVPEIKVNSMKELVVVANAMHPLERELVFGPLMRMTLNELDLKSPEPESTALILEEGSIIFPPHAIAFSHAFGFSFDEYTHINDAEKYNLALMSELPENNLELAKEGKIYLSDNDKYVVRDPKGEVQQGTLELDDKIDLSDLANNLMLKSKILKITSKAGHTHAEGMPDHLKNDIFGDKFYRVRHPFEGSVGTVNLRLKNCHFEVGGLTSDQVEAHQSKIQPKVLGSDPIRPEQPGARYYEEPSIDSNCAVKNAHVNFSDALSKTMAALRERPGQHTCLFKLEMFKEMKQSMQLARGSNLSKEEPISTLPSKDDHYKPETPFDSMYSGPKPEGYDEK